MTHPSSIDALEKLGPLAPDLRQADPDRFFAALFAKEPGRGHLLALWAFNQEIAKIGAIVSEPMVGEIRLRWWHEQLDPIAAGTPPAHPVAEALSAAIQATQLDVDAFRAIVDARVADCYPEPFPEAADFEAYVSQTGGTLHRVAADLLARLGGVALSDEARAAANYAGQAWARLGALRALPYETERGRIALPKDRVLAAGLTPEAGLKGCASDLLMPILSAILNDADRDFAEARSRFAQVPVCARPALLHLARFPSLSGAMRRAGFRLDGAGEPERPLARQAGLLLAALRGRI